jgi:hypothetical protein
MRKFLFLFFFFILSCVKTQNYREELKIWLGGDINDLIREWGNPSYEYAIPQKSKIYTWLWIGKKLISKQNYEETIKKFSFNDSSKNWCRTSFVTDPNGKILNFTFDGTYCRTKRKK